MDEPSSAEPAVVGLDVLVAPTAGVFEGDKLGVEGPCHGYVHFICASVLFFTQIKH